MCLSPRAVDSATTSLIKEWSCWSWHDRQLSVMYSILLKSYPTLFHSKLCSCFNKQQALTRTSLSSSTIPFLLKAFESRSEHFHTFMDTAIAFSVNDEQMCLSPRAVDSASTSLIKEWSCWNWHDRQLSVILVLKQLIVN